MVPVSWLCAKYSTLQRQQQTVAASTARLLGAQRHSLQVSGSAERRWDGARQLVVGHVQVPAATTA
jgi:hypothetical protein